MGWARDMYYDVTRLRSHHNTTQLRSTSHAVYNHVSIQNKKYNNNNVKTVMITWTHKSLYAYRMSYTDAHTHTLSYALQHTETEWKQRNKWNTIDKKKDDVSCFLNLLENENAEGGGASTAWERARGVSSISVSDGSCWPASYFWSLLEN